MASPWAMQACQTLALFRACVIWKISRSGHGLHGRCFQHPESGTGWRGAGICRRLPRSHKESWEPRKTLSMGFFARLHGGQCWGSWGAYDRRQIERESARHGLADPLAGFPTSTSRRPSPRPARSNRRAWPRPCRSSALSWKASTTAPSPTPGTSPGCCRGRWHENLWHAQKRIACGVAARAASRCGLSVSCTSCTRVLPLLFDIQFKASERPFRCGFQEIKRVRAPCTAGIKETGWRPPRVDDYQTLVDWPSYLSAIIRADTAPVGLRHGIHQVTAARIGLAPDWNRPMAKACRPCHSPMSRRCRSIG